MAIKIPTKGETFKVIVSIDSSLEKDAEAYEKYLQTLDESHLKFIAGEEPTRFVMRKVLPYNLQQKVQNAQIEISESGTQIKPAFMMEEVRCSLVGIENPASLPAEEHIKFEKHSDGGASTSLMEMLNAVGLVNDLYKAKAYAVLGFGDSLKKK